MRFFKKILSIIPTTGKIENEDQVEGFTFNQKGEIKGSFNTKINGEEISIPINSSVAKLQKESEGSKNPNSCIREPYEDEIKIPIDGFLQKYQTSIPKHVFNSIQDAVLDGYNNFLINKNDFKIMIEYYDRYKEYEDALIKTRDLNNKGSAYEKEGDIQSAIDTYEENIKIGYQASHSFDRLMVLYRKNKKPHEELRVIEKAIEVFSKEKKKRFDLVMGRVSESIKVDIIRCYEQNKQLKDNCGDVIFTPYNINLDRYIKRREKVINSLKKGV